MSDSLSALSSVEVLQAYLLAYIQSRSEDERLSFAARLRQDEGFMASTLELLHATHDAMVACLRQPDEGTPARIALLVQSPDLFDSDLASVACYTLDKFSRAIVMDLEGEDVPRARLRLQGLVDAVRERVASIRLH
jgi:hypothetical protein